MKGYITYYVHNGSVYIFPHYATVKELTAMINELREADVEAMNKDGAAHAVYGVKKYDPETGKLSRVDLYAPAVLLDDADFYSRTDAEAKENPGCIILASHAHK